MHAQLIRTIKSQRSSVDVTSYTALDEPWNKEDMGLVIVWHTQGHWQEYEQAQIIAHINLKRARSYDMLLHSR